MSSICCGNQGLMNSALTNKFPWQKKTDENDQEEMISTVNTNSNKPNLLGFGNLKKGKFSDREMKYELCKWRDLPMNARRAAEDLGYDREMWDAKEACEADHKHWWDLTEKERQAVEVLGWEESAWEHRYEHCSWADLPALQKRAAVSAGFDQHMWDDDHWPENLNKRWDDLTDSDRQAMSVLGWHKGKWD